MRLGVEPLAEFRDVTVRAILKGSPAPGYWISNITVEPANVTMQGKPETIRQMPAVVSTVPIDISGVKESVAKRVSLVLPQGISMYSADANGQTVLVLVEVSAISGGKTIQPKLEVMGLRSGLAATTSPDTVDVILSGPMPELQALQPDDVRVVANLFGMGVGRYQVTPTVLLPEGSTLKVESIAPDMVEASSFMMGAVAVASWRGRAPKSLVLHADFVAQHPQTWFRKLLSPKVVDLGCYLGHAAVGEKHASCATKCIAGGMPMGLLTADGKLYLLTMNHDNADPYQQLKSLAAKKVTVTGMLMERSGMKGLDVTAVKAPAAAAGK